MKYLHQNEIRDLEDKDLQLLYLLGGLNSKEKTVCNANVFWGCDIRCSCSPVPDDERIIRVKEFIKKHNISNETFMRLTRTYLCGQFVKYKGEYGELILELDRVLMSYNFIHTPSDKIPAEDLKEKELIKLVEKYADVEGSKLNEFLNKYLLTKTDFIVLAKTSINYNYKILRGFKMSDLSLDLFNLLTEFDLYQSLDYVREQQKLAKEKLELEKDTSVQATKRLSLFKKFRKNK